MNEWLPEQLKTVINLCEIADILIQHSVYDLLPTVLELILVEVQLIVDENCIEG